MAEGEAVGIVDGQIEIGIGAQFAGVLTQPFAFTAIFERHGVAARRIAVVIGLL